MDGSLRLPSAQHSARTGAVISQRGLGSRRRRDRKLPFRGKRVQVFPEISFRETLPQFPRLFHGIIGPGDGKTVKQISGRGRPGLVDLSPDKSAPVFRPRQRDVQEPAVLRKGFPRGVQGVSFPVRRAEIHGQAKPFGAVMIKKFALPDAGPLPEEWAEDDGEFQPLALVDGQDLNRVGIALQTQLIFPKPGRFPSAGLRKPSPQTADVEVLFQAGAVKKFRKVLEVGEPPLAARKPQQAASDGFLLEQRPEHENESALPPLLMIVEESLPPLRPGRLVASPRIDFGGRRAEKFRRQCRRCQSIGPRHADRREKNLHLFGFRCVENIRRSAPHAVDPLCGQFLRNKRRLAVCPHQDGDIALSEVSVPDPGFSLPPQEDESRDLRCYGFRRGFAGGRPRDCPAGCAEIVGTQKPAA